ncbi:ABC transporter permease [Phytoactinopolyspora limicola]|uniref:ABC transporter permease n=1 Tax=Phytoactinopolyspora limicola TaxID=2715536 RepID=UPI001A9C5449|nr:iron ABC transporter permease [Phytoactinopolyspora limicola]
MASLLLLGVLVAWPLFLVVVRAVTGHRGQPGELGALLESSNLEVVTNTVVLGLMVIVVATLLAAPLAFLMSRTRFRRFGWIDVAVLVPFMTPPYISALAWMEFTRRGGLAESWLGPVGGLVQDVFATPAGMAIVMGSEVFPFLYLILRNSLDRVGATMDEAASVHGASVWRRFGKVLVPLISSGYSMGILLVFVRAAGEFGTPVTLGNQIGFPVLVSKIHEDVTIDPLNFPHAAAMASILLGIGITVWAVQQWFVARQADRTVGIRAQRMTTVGLKPWAVAVAWCWIGSTMVVTAVLPGFVVVTGALTNLRSRGVAWDNLTLDHFADVLTPGGGGMDALTTSVWLALVAATVTTILGTMFALLTNRRRTATARGIDFLSVAPDTVPTIVLALGFIFLWNAPWMPWSPYNTYGILILAYVVIFLPLVIQNVKAVRIQISDRLLEAAVVSGASGWTSTRRVLLPLLMPGVVAGWLLAFVIGIRELVASSLVRPPSVNLVSPWILNQFDQGNRPQAMAMTVIVIFTSTAAILLVDRWRVRLRNRQL